MWQWYEEMHSDKKWPHLCPDMKLHIGQATRPADDIMKKQLKHIKSYSGHWGLNCILTASLSMIRNSLREAFFMIRVETGC